MKDGIIYDLAREQYDAEDREHWSGLKHMGKSPAHYAHHRAHGEGGDTNARKLGRCVHLAILEPVQFAASVATWMGDRRYGKEWDAFCAANQGKEILTRAETAYCAALQRAARASPMAAPYLSGGHAEVSLLWTHDAGPEVGEAVRRVAMKGRVDFLTPGAIVDVKTTRDASPEGFGRELWRYHYQTQAAIYSDAIVALTGKRLPVVFVAIEKEPPHIVQVYTVPDAAFEAGQSEYRCLLSRLAMCRAENRWPGYCEDVADVELPKWSGLADDDDLTGMDLELPEGEGSEDAA